MFDPRVAYGDSIDLWQESLPRSSRIKSIRPSYDRLLCPTYEYTLLEAHALRSSRSSPHQSHSPSRARTPYQRLGRAATYEHPRVPSREIWLNLANWITRWLLLLIAALLYGMNTAFVHFQPYGDGSRPSSNTVTQRFARTTSSVIWAVQLYPRGRAIGDWRRP